MNYQPGARLAVLLLTLLGATASARAATYLVKNTNDAGPNSLRQAIIDSNAAPNSGGPDLISFELAGASVHTIQLLSPLPAVTDAVVIDGYTQSGSQPNTNGPGLPTNAVITIELNGELAGVSAVGLEIRANGVTVRGLAINRFANDGIFVGTSNNIIEGNFIGSDVSGGAALGNGSGILCFGAGTTNNRIGGNTPAARNIISGNRSVNVDIESDSSGNVVSGNFIGTNAAGTAAIASTVASGVLIYSASLNIIGGTSPESRNLISGNPGAGVLILGVGGPIGSNVVAGNFIGSDLTATAAVPNGAGVRLSGAARDNVIGGSASGAGNLIAYNLSAGVQLDPSSSDGTPINTQVLRNSIFSNIGIGIDLNSDGPTPNDKNDGDSGPNNLQNFPVITSTTFTGSSATIRGTLNSTPSTSFTIQLFADSQSLTGAGQIYLGSTTVTTDSLGDASFAQTYLLPGIGFTFNATATDPNGNTSEFARNFARLLNISTRARVGTGDNVLIGGFIIQGAVPKKVILRAIGPSLGAGVAGPLADPTLELHDATGAAIAFNNNWGDTQRADIQATGVAPSNELESAIVRTLAPGAYTAIVRGAGGATGVAVVEAYDLEQTTPAKALNISTRGVVDTGDNVMIGGFIVGAAAESPRFLIRGLGPSLASAGVANPLPDPVLELHDSSGALITSNDNWRDTQPTEISSTGIAPTTDLESAILMRLGPGSYTAILRGKANANGAGLIEVYNLP